MKKLIVVILGLVVSFSAISQQLYFVAIDADQQQPFAVLMGKKAYSSNSQGHLILSSLKDSAYDITVSFPRNSFPEQHFRIEIKKKDRGFQLKKTGERSWGLYDWQTMELMQPIQPVTYASLSNSQETRKDAFAVMMAAVVNDTAVLIRNTSKPIAKNTPEKKPAVKDTVQKETAPLVKIETAPKTDPPKKVDLVIVPSPPPTDSVQKEVVVQKPAAKDSVATAKETAVVLKDTVQTKAVTLEEKTVQKDTAQTVTAPPAPVLKNEIRDSVALPPAPYPAIVRKMFDNTGKETRAIVFRDSSSAGVDTISIKIDLETGVSEKETIKLMAPSEGEKQPAVAEKQTAITEKKTDTVSLVKTAPAPAKKKTEDTVVTKVNPKPEEVREKEAPVTPTKKDTITSVSAPRSLSMVNSDCVNKATDADVDKLRVKMLSAATTDDRVVLARKIFKTKCFTTRQIKALSELFLSDESRYQFFDAAYPFVVDTDEFKTLVNLFSETYYINRFKAMVRY